MAAAARGICFAVVLGAAATTGEVLHPAATRET